jgi:acyl-CoA dehydrogenase
MSERFSEELEMFRDTVRRFFEKELVSRGGQLGTKQEAAAFWKASGDLGLLGAAIPEEYGGPGLDRLSIVIIAEELGRLTEGAIAGANLTSDMATSVLIDGGSEAQKREWFPKILRGEVIQALAMTEPGAGSDAGAIKTTASRDGDTFVINGHKIFISNGSIADLIYVIAKTDRGARHQGHVLLHRPRRRARPLARQAQHARLQGRRHGGAVPRQCRGPRRQSGR